MTKILLIAPTCDGEDVGEAWVAYQWARGLADHHDVTLLTYHKRGAQPAAEQLKHVRVVEWTEPPLVGRAERLNSILKPGYVPFYFRARRWINQALARGERFDVVHQPTPVAMRYPSPATGFPLPVVIGPVGGGMASPEGFRASESGSPWYMRLRGLDHTRREYDPLLRRTYEEAACVLGIAPYVRDELAKYKLKRFEVMSETGLTALTDRIERANAPLPVRLLFVGRLVRTKGVLEAIRSMALCKDLPCQLDVVGDGPERRRAERMIADLQLSGRVTMHGWRSKAEVAEFYRAADVFVFPSYREPGGNVAPEAMSFSLPLIVVDRGGPGSAVSDACAIKLAAVTPEKLTQDVAEAIRTLVTSPDLRLRMGAAAYDHVRKTGLWSAKIARVASLYRQIADGPPLVKV